MRARLSLAAVFIAVSAAAQTTVTVNVDASADRHTIDARIYGLAFASAAQLSELNVPTNRSGGNGTTRYNWQSNASNHANDWYFESISDDGTAAGASADSFIGDAKASGVQPMMTIPMIGWVAKLGNNRAKLASFSVAKYGAQQSTDYWMPDAGNGVRANGTLISGNDPNDANMPADAAFQRSWIQHLIAQWGAANAGGVRYYFLDNEHSLWQSTHRDVHPVGANMDEIVTKMTDYARTIKAADPNAIVLGPEEWGWSGYLYSGYDQQYGSAHGWSNLPDRIAHGNKDYVPYILEQMKNQATSGRLLDVLTVHYYPQGGEFSDDTSDPMQLRRNRSTRSLWDPNYTDETWINDKVRLIPRLRNWVSTIYPGTLTGLTEYNWGAEGHINGATTQADIFGIFGREGLDIANRWTTPASGSPVYNSIRMYRNYDGSKSTFGETSARATVPNPDNLSAFAATRRDGALTVMLINKVTTSATVTVNVAHRTLVGGTQVWQLTSTNTITRLANITPSGQSLTITVPPQSITLLVFPRGGTSKRRAV
jgi:hypothetical protein